MDKKLLIYLDILGFEELAEEIEKNENIPSERVRKDFFIDPLKREIKKLKNDGKIVGGKPIADDWILVTDGFENLFESISKILRIKIDIIKYINNPKKSYGNVQFEIAIGSYEFNEWATLDGDEIICGDNTIKYLKTYLIKEYQNFYKTRNSERITESFVIASDSFIDELNLGMKRHFVEAELTYFEKTEKKTKRYYLLNKENIQKEGKISEFLKKISQTRSDFSGALINRLYVLPDEFDEIKEKLKNDRIVFITGTTGYGKTYTAIRLLWEWYNNGYTPKWIVGKEEKQRENVRDKLANIDAELKPHHIIYFEDPFGRTRYERRDDLKEKINSIITSIKNKEDVYAIITSRRDVFEQFEKESYSVEGIKKFEQQLNILKPSYSFWKRIKILEKWAEEKECEWLNYEKLKKFVFGSLEDEKILPTPLNIHDFVIATSKIKNEKELKEELNKYSEEGEKAFADEIKGLYYSGRKDRVLFLSFIFISQSFEVDFIKKQYEDMNYENYEGLEKILHEEHRVKKTVLRKPPSRYNRFIVFAFSHPSYFKALPYILDDSGCRKIFCDVLRKLADIEEAVRYVIRAIAENFDKLPRNVTNELLLKLADREEAAKYVARAIAEIFDKLPGNIRTELLLKLADRKEATEDLANVIAENFDKLPNSVQNIFFKVAGKKYEAKYIVWAIVKNFNNLPNNVQNLLFELANREYAAGYVLWAVAIQFYELPEKVQNLLNKTSTQR